jgi:hypothetical protein
MPTTEEWARVHADLTRGLRLPCKLRFSSLWKVGAHDWNCNLGKCDIVVNPFADFRVPAHLILHEGAHHYSCPCLFLYGKGHCRHWARVLCDMYKETGIALPHATGFKEFARAAGIVHKIFDPSEALQMQAIADNPQLVEGADA